MRRIRLPLSNTKSALVPLSCQCNGVWGESKAHSPLRPAPMGSCIANAIERVETALEVPESDEAVDTNGYFDDDDEDVDVDAEDADLGSDVLYRRPAAEAYDSELTVNLSDVLGVPGGESGMCYRTASGRRLSKLVDDEEAGLAKSD